MNIETIFEPARPRPGDPLGQRHHIAMKFAGAVEGCVVIALHEDDAREDAVREALAGIEAKLIEAAMNVKEPPVPGQPGRAR